MQAEKIESVGRLAGGIAHDFNNLLTAILGYTELLLGHHPEGDPDHDDLMAIQSAGQRAASLTQQLLAFGRKQVLQPQALDLNQTMAGLQPMLRRVSFARTSRSTSSSRRRRPSSGSIRRRSSRRS